MIASFVQEGANVDYTPAADVAIGDVVVQGDLIGVAKRAITANTLGSLSLTGVFDLPKAAGVGTAIAAGVTVYWNSAAKQATATAAGNKLLGKTIRASLDADTTARVRLSQ